MRRVAADEHLLASMRALGASQADVDAVVAELGGDEASQPTDEDGGTYWMEPDNWESWKVFDAVSTQWVWAPMGMQGAMRVALDFARVESGLRMLGVPRREWPQRFEDLRLIERTVLDVDREMLAKAPRGR